MTFIDSAAFSRSWKLDFAAPSQATSHGTWRIPSHRLHTHRRVRAPLPGLLAVSASPPRRWLSTTADFHKRSWKTHPALRRDRNRTLSYNRSPAASRALPMYAGCAGLEDIPLPAHIVETLPQASGSHG